MYKQNSEKFQQAKIRNKASDISFIVLEINGGRRPQIPTKMQEQEQYRKRIG